MTLWKSQNQRDSRKVSGSQGFRGREEGVSGAQWSFRVVETVLHDTVRIDYIIIFLKAHYTNVQYRQ